MTQHILVPALQRGNALATLQRRLRYIATRRRKNGTLERPERHSHAGAWEREEGLWASADWRRLHLVDGKLQERSE